ncbi:MAG: hypothetical protein COA43_05435 [Robiginitomaculum sp.]|nr:MAG: hypothetical protein COA43_05435 [Robiginitomaculum sp.]
MSVFGLAIWSSTGIAVAADDIKNKLRAAERSPLFQQKFASSEITAKNLDRVVMQNGAELNFKKYTTLTRLDTSEKFQPLMNPQIVSRYLRSKPRYRENIIQMEDRLIVERTLDVEIKEGTCAKNGLPAAVDELCFKAKEGAIPEESREYLANIRRKLNSARPEVVIKQGRTAQQMLALSDKQLLELLLNSDNRKVRLVSVLPTRVYNKRTALNLWSTNTRLKTSNLKFSKTTAIPFNQKMTTVPKTSQNGGKPHNQVFPKKYFLTGYTIGRSIEDEFEIEFAGETLFTDRYYVRFSYKFSAGFGLRFPFSVSASSKVNDGVLNGNQVGEFQPLVAVYGLPAGFGTSKPSKAPVQTAPVQTSPVRKNPVKTTPGKTKSLKDRILQKTTLGSGGMMCGSDHCSSGGPSVTSAQITMSVAPVNVNSSGQPAYSAVGLPQNKYFDGKEFVLKFSASCKFKASIPGPDINVSCPTINKDYGRQINPVLGNARTDLAALWIDGAALGLGINVWAGKASIDFGIQANITNGRIGVVAKGFNGTKIRGAQSSAFKFNSTTPINFDVKNTSGRAVFELTNPSYGFDLEILPVARMKLNLDLGVYELNKTLGPYGIDALSLSLASFNLPHHEGTVKSHIYIP